jgi:hypothetical protein
MSKEYHKKSEDKDRRSKCVIHGCDFLSCAVDASGRGNSSIPFDISMDCFWMTKLEETELQLLATTSLHIPGSWFSWAVLQVVGNKTRPFLEWMESGIVTV